MACYMLCPYYTTTSTLWETFVHVDELLLTSTKSVDSHWLNVTKHNLATFSYYNSLNFYNIILLKDIKYNIIKEFTVKDIELC